MNKDTREERELRVGPPPHTTTVRRTAFHLEGFRFKVLCSVLISLATGKL